MNKKNFFVKLIIYLIIIIKLMLDIWIIYILFNDLIKPSNIVALTSLLIMPNQAFIILGVIFLVYGFFYRIPLLIKISPFVSIFLSLPIILGFIYKWGIIINIIGLILIDVIIFINVRDEFIDIFKKKS